MKVMHFSALAAIVVAMLAPTPVAAREMLTAQTLKTMCQNMMSCNKGGVEGNTCTMKTQSCPPCVTFENNGCFEFQNGKCNFGEDCKQAWESADEPTTAPPANNNNNGGTPSSGSKGSSGGAGSAGVAGNSTGVANSTTKAPSSKDAKTTDSKADSGTDMTVVFGIVGAAIGVIAVAVIFLALVRRSRAAEEDDDELAGTPPAMAKTAAGPSTTTNAASYAPYAQRAPQANPTTPTNRVIKYYNDNALPSPHGARGAGGFGQQSQPAQVKTVRPAAAANAPTFFKPNPPTAAPLPQQARTVAAPPPVQQQQFVSQEQNYYAQATTSMPVAAQYPHAEPLFTVHTGPEEPQLVRRESSPRPRRESYEF